MVLLICSSSPPSLIHYCLLIVWIIGTFHFFLVPYLPHLKLLIILLAMVIFFSSTSSKGSDGSNSLAATQQTDPEHKPGLNENDLECWLKDDNHKIKSRDIGTGNLKCYKRRRIRSASGN